MRILDNGAINVVSGFDRTCTKSIVSGIIASSSHGHIEDNYLDESLLSAFSNNVLKEMSIIHEI